MMKRLSKLFVGFLLLSTSGCDAFDKLGSGRIDTPKETVKATDELGKSKLHEWRGTFGDSRLVNISANLPDDIEPIIEIGANEESFEEIPLEEKYDHNRRYPYAVFLRKPGVVIFSNVNDDNLLYRISYWEK